MATTINIGDLTNGSKVNNEWQGTGVFDTLINAVNGNINLQYEQGRITATDYANVYLGSMQSVISQSLEYLLKHELIAAQIDGEKANNDIKAVQLAEEQYKLNTLLPDEHSINTKKELEIDKSIDVQERNTIIQETKLADELATAEKQRLLLDKDAIIKDKQSVEEQYKIDILLPDEHNINTKKEAELVSTTAKIDADTQLLIDQDSELLANGLKDRSLKDVQISEEQYKLNTLLPDEHTKAIEQLKEIKASAILKDKEAVKAGLDKLTKTITANPEDIYTLKYGV